MRKLTGLMIAGFLLCIVPRLAAQDHAPLLDQCKADLALWYSEDARTEYLQAEIAHKRDGANNRSEYAHLSIKTLGSRLTEMNDCWSVSKRDEHYYNAVVFFSDVISDRYYSFLTRHHLMKQVLTEDEAGIR